MIQNKTKIDLIKKWEEIAKKEKINVSKKFIYGDRLYEDVFRE